MLQLDNEEAGDTEDMESAVPVVSVSAFDAAAAAAAPAGKVTFAASMSPGGQDPISLDVVSPAASTQAVSSEAFRKQFQATSCR